MTLDDPTHSKNVLIRLQKLRNSDVLCDCVISATGGASFNVHRSVLAACSEYFEEHFKKNKTEFKISMDHLNPKAVKICIDFMYTGSAKVSSKNVGNVLMASTVMKLDTLSQLCIDWKKNTPKPVREKDKVSQSGDKSESGISSTKHTDDSPVFSTKKPYEMTWEKSLVFIRKDIDTRKHLILQRLNELMLAEPTVDFILSVVWKEPLVKGSAECRELVAQRLLSSLYELKANIKLDNCCLLKNIVKHCRHPGSQEAKEFINVYLKTNFQLLVSQDVFKNLEKDEAVNLLQTSAASEIMKWEAALTWTKKDKRRTKSLPDLLRCLDFNQLPSQFIQDRIRNEPLVMASVKCKEIIADAFFVKASAAQNRMDGIKREAEEDLSAENKKLKF